MIRYFINEAKRTVVAKFDGDSDYGVWRNILSDDVMRLFSYIQGNYFLDHRRDVVIMDAVDRVLADIRTFFGKARCTERDVFRVEIGRQIARKRLLLRYEKAKQRVVNLLRKEMMEEYERYNNEAGGVMLRICRLERMIAKLTRS